MPAQGNQFRRSSHLSHSAHRAGDDTHSMTREMVVILIRAVLFIRLLELPPFCLSLIVFENCNLTCKNEADDMKKETAVGGKY